MKPQNSHDWGSVSAINLIDSPVLLQARNPQNGQNIIFEISLSLC